MQKRGFLTAAAAGALLPLASRAAPAPGTTPANPTLLTVSGDIARSNRGPLDPVMDQMMFKHGIQFQRAWSFDALALRKLAAQSIRTTLEYDGKKHTLLGPRLSDVLMVAGVRDAEGVQLGLRAVDGYRAPVSLRQVRQWNMLVALEMDGKPLALGGLGPQWAVYDADQLAEFRDKPLAERFAACPWGLYSIEVGRG
ncbi:molybdopterin-dependent oxidoreductase [Comamonas flocculans]|uniref:Molybdopterin-dependent oxidoreductase n=1 Tax=Comamonas flocculans TaxID=2597701 RepID=A0A5B8RZU9_9BURK|nr:molybdopterin-dependent oxidoreductase [Comamonas flocculans]QEA13497.1 molybdopterin-dependent oxidoreductase [Comamonas flocculans]